MCVSFFLLENNNPGSHGLCLSVFRGKVKLFDGPILFLSFLSFLSHGFCRCCVFYVVFRGNAFENGN